MKVYGKTLSIIVPCYNEEESVPLFYAETKKQEAFFHEKDIELEFVFVDDGSKDRTVEAVKKLHEQDGRVHLVSFSRNFGKEAAIIAGLEKASGDFYGTNGCGFTGSSCYFAGNVWIYRTGI